METNINKITNELFDNYCKSIITLINNKYNCSFYKNYSIFVNELTLTCNDADRDAEILIDFIYLLDPTIFSNIINYDIKDLRKYIKTNKRLPYTQIRRAIYKNNGHIMYFIKLDILTYAYVNMHGEDENHPCIFELYIFGKNADKIDERYKKFKMKRYHYFNNMTAKHIRSIDYNDKGYTNYALDTKAFKSIIISDEIYNEINTIIKSFYSMKKYYSEHELIHKIGILLYGKPGTGKTSIIKAIATETKSLLVNFSVGGNIKTQINSFYENLSMGFAFNRFIITFEDIDYMFRNRENVSNQKEREKINIIMNFIDGLNSPNFKDYSFIFIATTNKINELDSALIREGRFDLKIEIGDFTEELAKKYCDMMDTDYSIIYNEDGTLNLNPAYLQSRVLKEKMKIILNGGTKNEI